MKKKHVVRDAARNSEGMLQSETMQNHVASDVAHFAKASIERNAAPHRAANHCKGVAFHAI